jgi:hypothetical protein
MPEITSLTTRKSNKNIVTICFSIEHIGNHSIIIDLITDLDSKGFIAKTKQYIENYEKQK